jgi:hypothetical protein
VRNKIILSVFLSAGASAWAETEFFACSESGQGPAYFKVCVSDTGNVTRFESPLGQEHVRVGNIGLDQDDRGALEGYMVCRLDESGTLGGIYDYGNYYPDPADRPGVWSRGWDPPHRIEQPNGPGKFPLIIYRRQVDLGFPTQPRFELKQAFAVATLERELTITATLFVRGTQRQQDVRLVRLVDFDVDNTAELELFLGGARSVVEFDSGPPNGEDGNSVSLTALSSSFPVQFTNYDFDRAQDLCWFTGWKHSGRGAGGIRYLLGDIAPGGQRTVKFVYRAH